MKLLSGVLDKNWSSLHKLGNSKLIRSSYVWIAVVPIFAKLLSHVQVPSTLSFRLFDAQIQIAAGLPFSWQIFFFAALFFSIASLLYSAFLPFLIARYQDYAEYETQGHSRRHLLHAVHDYIRLLPNGETREKRLIAFFEQFCKGDRPKIKFPTMGYFMEAFDLDIRQERICDAFWHVRDCLDDYAHPNIRKVVVLCYLVGGALLSVVLLQNIYAVVMLSDIPFWLGVSRG